MRDTLKKCRGLSIPVIFACDSFLAKDFIFKGRMKPHAIRGTEGTKPLSDLEPETPGVGEQGGPSGGTPSPGFSGSVLLSMA